ncbi:MAG: hypothetical protein ABIZ09_05825 [Rhodoferax sp.]
MDVNSINKPTVKPVPAPKPAAESRPAPVREKTESQDNEARKTAQAQQNKPVVNAQGQVTGRSLNVTA